MDTVTVDEEIVIGFSTDKAYWLGALVMLRSILENCANPGRILFVGIDAGLRADERFALKRIVRSFGARLDWLKFPHLHWQELQGSLTRPLAAYARLFFADLLPNTYLKLIYLDCDTVVLGDIAELFSLDVRGYPLLASSDINLLRTNNSREVKSDCKGQLLTIQPYFDTGVLVLNLEYWRQTKLRQSLSQNLRTETQHGHTTDSFLLNQMLIGQWGKLAPIWNYPIYSTSENRQQQEIYHAIFNGLRGLELPKILHFVSSAKPWQQNYTHAAKQIFFYYLDKTFMKDWRPEQARIPIY